MVFIMVIQVGQKLFKFIQEYRLGFVLGYFINDNAGNDDAALRVVVVEFIWKLYAIMLKNADYVV